MSDSNIANVSFSMITLLRKQMEDLVPNPDHIVLLSPADVDEQGQDIRLTLYLYKVLQNPIIKNRPKLKVNHIQRRYPPLTLDLYYLLTTHAPRNIPRMTGRWKSSACWVGPCGFYTTTPSSSAAGCWKSWPS